MENGNEDSSSVISSQPRQGRKRFRRRCRSNRSFSEVRRSTRTRRRKVVDGTVSVKSILTSSSSSSSSESDTDLKSKCKRSRNHELLKTPVGKGKRNILDEIQPLNVDKSLTFQSVGGLESHIQKLKEMVVFPLLYKEFYKNRGITPPRGVLFHGPPGTGKTLMARVLASEASFVGGREVTVFVRKGADVLNKWIGESERHLKLVFEQAVFKQPSIIFFDEIDGLAPMRSSKTDQIHNSVVSTLLAEMDGLKDRGDVIVIGATNRIDTLDPALRRPGRFDLEFQFLLPSYHARQEIISINVAKWNPPVSTEMMGELALLTVGYSGADIKLLCSEASVCALRRRYPQIYRSNNKFVLDYDSIKVERCDWEEAMNVVGRSSDRSVFSSFFTPLPLPRPLDLLLNSAVGQIQEKIRELFPYKSKIITQPASRTLLIDMGINHGVLQHVISASLWDSIDRVPIHILTMQTLVTKNVSIEDGNAIALFFSEVKREKTPCVVYIPYLDHFADSLSSSAHLILEQQLSALSFFPVLTIAYCEKDTLLGDELKGQFQSLQISHILTKERCAFFRNIFHNVTRVKANPPVVTEDVLEIAPLEPIPLNPEQLAWTERIESRTMRELRAFLREVVFKLLRRKKFAPFAKPVDPVEVPDYHSLILRPMDLEKMMLKVTNGEYHCARDFLADINLIVENCLEYNPTKTDEDRELRCTAIELKDVAKSIIDREMDSDFEDNCIKITQKREERRIGLQNQDKRPDLIPSFTIGSPGNIEVSTSTPGPPSRGGHSNVTRRKKKSVSDWARGEIKKKRSPRKNSISSASSGTTGSVKVSTSTPQKNNQRGSKSNWSCDTTIQIQNYSDTSNQEIFDIKPKASKLKTKKPVVKTEPEPVPDAEGYIPLIGRESDSKKYKLEVKKIYELGIRNTMHYSIRQLLDLRFQLLSLIDQYGNSEDKSALLVKLRQVVESIQQS